jgi:hypothetical protein
LAASGPSARATRKAWDALGGRQTHSSDGLTRRRAQPAAVPHPQPHLAGSMTKRGPRSIIDALKEQAVENDCIQLEHEVYRTGRTLSDAQAQLQLERQQAAHLQAEAERHKARDEADNAALESRERMQLLERERLARVAEQLAAQRQALEAQLRTNPVDIEAAQQHAREEAEAELQAKFAAWQ